MFHRLTSSAGFTLIAAMTAVVIIGIMLGATGQSWQMFMKREREEDLMFRGLQYRDAITRWYNPNLKLTPQGTPQGALAPPLNKPLLDIKYLSEGDPSLPNRPRYLRKAYLDPITGEDFEPVKEAGIIIGVRSKSKEEPLKKGNFPDDLKDFGDKKSYSDWQFVYRTQPLTPASTTSVTGLPGAEGTPGP